MKLPASLFRYREAKAEDLPFILDAWIRSFRNSPFGRTLTDEAYRQIQSEAVTQILQVASVLVVCLADDPDCIIGFVCHGKTKEGFTLIHYIYVKHSYRNAGLAQQLVTRIKTTVPAVASQVNQRFEELRLVNFLPILTMREYEQTLAESDDPSKDFNQWFIDQLPKFRAQRADVMKERNQRAYKTKHRTRIL